MRILIQKYFLLSVMLLSSIGLPKSVEEREKEISMREQAMSEQVVRHKKYIDQLIEEHKKEQKAKSEKIRELEIKLSSMIKEKKIEIEKITKKNEEQQIERRSQFLSIYEKMEPKRAAKILENIERKIASEIISEMRPQRAAEILGKMSPDTAKEITENSLSKKDSRRVNNNKENSPIAPIGTVNNEERR